MVLAQAMVLACSELPAADGSTDRVALILHGILGSKSNFRSIARQLQQRLPGWGFVLVDLRMHGESQGFPPPHTVEAAAADLEALPYRVRAVIGHSFGGKVALRHAERNADSVERLVVLDSQPGANPEREGSEATEEVRKLLRELPREYPTRDAFIDRLVGAGQSRTVAQWLAMNLERDGDGFRLRLDLDAIDALLADYFRTDLWHVLEGGRPPALLVIGGRSPVLDDEDRRRARSIAALEVVEIPEAGHWVHVEAPGAVVDSVVSIFKKNPVRPPPE